MKLYSTKCPKCLVVEAKLKLKNLDFDLVTDIDEVVKIGKEHNITSAPILEVEGNFYDFTAAIKYLKEVK